MMDPKIEASQLDIIRAFNIKPKDGIEKIKELLGGEENIEKEIAEFFIKNKQRLDLEKVGDFLSEDPQFKPLNGKVLEAFSGMIDLKGQSFTEGLRTFLKEFKLPGEGQKIDRLMESFGAAFHAQNPGVVADKDAAYLLAYQTIMLNTNLHNPSVKEKDKYTVEGILKILKGSNGGGNFDEELIKQIFEEIKAKPFEFNFAKTAPGYELNTGTLYNDPTFKKMDSLLQSKASPQDTFPGIGPKVTVEVGKPKSWLNDLMGYKGKITLTDESTNAQVTVEVQQPNFFSKWLFGGKPKVVIQPVYKEGNDPKPAIDLAAKVAAGFKSEVNSITATYDYEAGDLKSAYEENRKARQIEVSKGFQSQYKKDIGEKRVELQQEKNRDSDMTIK